MIGEAMGNTRYMRISQEAAEAHDKKLNEVEVKLLDQILTANSTQARNYAEAYALIRGVLTSTSSTENKG